jgi:acyl-CoA synthetase (NDP forming)
MAVMGASEKPGSVGRQTMENLLTGGYDGNLYAVNPGYESVCGIPCYPGLQALPERVEHVALTLGDARIEAALDDVIWSAVPTAWGTTTALRASGCAVLIPVTITSAAEM